MLRKRIPGSAHEPLRLAGEFVQKNSDTIDGSGALEVSLNLLGRSAIVDIPNEDASSINVLTVFAEIMTLLIQVGLHLAKLGGFFLHLGDAALHGLNLLLDVMISSAMKRKNVDDK